MALYQEIDVNKKKTLALMALFVTIISALGWLFDTIFGEGYLFLVIALLFAVSTTIFSYYKGDAVALTASGAKPITKDDNPYVYRLVENLSIASGLPMPRIHIITDPALNAFATGRDPQHASLALTTGIIQALENEELEGVIAHELSHIKNYDIRVMMMVLVLVGTIGILAHVLLRAQYFGGSRRSRDGRAGVLLLILSIFAALLAPLAAQLIQLSISRKREFLADSSGALLTRYPEGLARALEKIAGGPPLARANAGTAHLFIANPFGGAAPRLARLFSTHPPIEERIAHLRQN